jgi:hypothetical protein
MLEYHPQRFRQIGFLHASVFDQARMAAPITQFDFGFCFRRKHVYVSWSMIVWPNDKPETVNSQYRGHNNLSVRLLQ